MHPDQTNATVEDLWPGDVIIARWSGGYTGMPHRFVDTWPGCSPPNVVVVKLASLDGEREFEVLAMDGWKTPVERVA